MFILSLIILYAMLVASLCFILKNITDKVFFNLLKDKIALKFSFRKLKSPRKIELDSVLYHLSFL